MATYYVKRALKILREEGPVELLKKSMRFPLRGLLGPLGLHYYHLFKFYTWKNHLENRIRYDAPPDPYKIIEIRPREIDERVGRRAIDGTKPKRPLRSARLGGLARTKGGKWDRFPYRSNVEHQSNKVIRSVIERFEQGKDWENTEYYNRILDKYSHSEIPNNNFENPEKFAKKLCMETDNLFESIKNNGYKRNYHNSSYKVGGGQPVRDKLEVLVTIDREGTVNFWEGQNRFAIARALDIVIPAQVVCRHKQWQKLRDEIHNNGLPEGRENLRNHPDLQDVIDY